MRHVPARSFTPRRTVAAGAVCTVAILALALPPGSASASTSTVASAKTQNVIVVLRDQHTDLTLAKGTSSPRANAFKSDQSTVAARAKSAGARNVHGFSTVNGFAASVTAAESAQLSADPAVAQVFPDLAISAPPLSVDRTVAAAAVAAAAPIGTTPLSGTCPADPAHPLLQPEALGVTNTAFDDPTTPQAQKIVDGTGVKVGFIADGLDINNPDFIRRDGTHVFVDYQDFSGDGPNAVTGGAEAFGDASAIAAQGRQVYDLSQHVNPAHPLPPGCNITVRGMAPGASLVGLKVFGNAPTAPTSRFIEAIDYAVATAGVDVLNESFGGNPFPDTGNDPITLADAAAVAAGVTVVASTGDAGTTGTIGSPASSGDIIGVGGTTTFQSYLQETGGGAQFSNGSWLSDNISGLSSGGFTQSGGVPDLVAPGDLGWALCSEDTALYEECTDDKGSPASIQDFGGTSQSSPLTAGAAALVIEAYENTHHGVRPTPALVKQLLTSTATDLGHPASEQGSGLLNSLAAVQAAESWADANGVPAVQSNSLVVDQSQLKISGNPNATKTATVHVTNLSTTRQVVTAKSRSFEHIVSTLNGTVALNTATVQAYLDAFGIKRSFVEQTFPVGTADRLDVSEASTTAPFASRIILIDPTGAFAAYSIPQGAANYAHIDVRFPKAGTWTAIFALSQSSGFNGTINYQVVQTDFATHGSLSPNRLAIGPGKTGTFKLTTKLPFAPRDVATSVQFTNATGVTTSLPVTLRAEIPPTMKQFNGTITGGNGRQQPAAQSNFYNLNVPAGQKSISIGVTFTDPNQIVLGYLVAPDGQVYSYRSNLDDPLAIQIYRRNPQAGRWLLDLNVLNPVSGNEISQKFTVKIAYNTVKITANALPNSAGTTLPGGVAKSVPVTITNNGNEPLVYFADPRLNTTGTIPLAELSGNATSALPMPPGVTPAWLVPSEVSQLNASAVADQPVNMDLFFQTGDPDVYSPAVGNGASVSVNAAQVSPGIWETDIGQTGPFAGPASPGTVTVSASAQGALFDPAVTSDGGDFWRLGVDPSPSPTLTAQVRRTAQWWLSGGAARSAPPASAQPAVGTSPLVLNPGQTGVLNVTITPSGPTGTVVSGKLYIDTVDLNVDAADELISLPYSYKIG